ncbi:MAG: group II intron reverse transcriptase/maturase [Draconibacterium sp.]|nr:group II intron reverse transcriptase/maturase [Draconibacterium sp.]
MIEQILTRKNLLQAMRKVQKNHGSAGVDHMPVTKLSELMSIDKEGLTAKVLSGNYLPQAILGVEISKGEGKTRLLGIPTVTDRLLQQAVLQIMMARFEFEFSGSSFGFRPNKNVQQAVMKAQGYINEGFQHIVDIDLKTFFDEVDHRYLLQLIYRKVKCRETLRLTRKWLRSPIQINGKLVKRRKGVPQGSPLSPLLSNIMLHELDRELERQGLRFVRYADDFSIYTKTKATARKVGNTIFKFLKNKLKLTINREKSGIRRPVHFTCLGFGFVPTFVKGEKGKYQLVVSKKSCPKGIPMEEEAKAKAQNPYPKNHSNEF